MGFQYEDLFLIIGDLGNFQLLILFIVHLPCMTVAIQTYSPLFTLYIQRHRCKLPQSIYPNDTFTPVSAEHEGLIREWIPRSMDGSSQECCLYRNSSSNASSYLCEAYVYDDSVIHTSATGDWNFICSSRSMTVTSECIMWMGVMAGAVFFGMVADKFGRSRAVTLAICVNICTGVVLSLAPSSFFYLLFLFSHGCTFSGLLMSTFVLSVEHIGPSQRHLVSVVNHAFVAIGCFILAALSYKIKDWRILQLAATATTLPYLIFFKKDVLPESPRWLFAKHRMEELYAILETAAKRNKVKLEHIHNLAGINDASISIIQAQPTTGCVKDIFNLKRPNFLLKTLIMFLNWFVISMLYYGLTMQAGKISSSHQVNLVISGSVELLAYVFCALTMMRWGRRQLLVFSHFLSAGALLMTLAFDPKNADGTSINPVVLVLLMVGKFGASISFTVICIYSCEIFPTVVRSLGVGFSSCCGRLGGVMAPLIASIDRQISVGSDICEDRSESVEAKWSFVITGSLALITGLFTTMLPETLNEPLPETCEDAEENGLLPCFKVTRCRRRLISSPHPSMSHSRPASRNSYHEKSLLLPKSRRGPSPLPPPALARDCSGEASTLLSEDSPNSPRLVEMPSSVNGLHAGSGSDAPSDSLSDSLPQQCAVSQANTNFMTVEDEGIDGDECALLPEVGAILPSSRTRSSVAKNHYTKLSRGNFASGETDPESDEDVRRMAADLASSRRH